MSTKKPTHGDIAREIIAKSPDFFDGFYTDYQNGLIKILPPVNGIRKFEYRFHVEIQSLILNHLGGSGLDNNQFITGVRKTIYMLLEPPVRN